MKPSRRYKKSKKFARRVPRRTRRANPNQHRYTLYANVTYDFSGQILVTRISEMLYQNDYFKKLQTQYQQYKLLYIRAAMIPKELTNSSPVIARFQCDPDEQYYSNSLYDINRRHCIPGRQTALVYRPRGWQDDVNYWYNTTGGVISEPTVKFGAKSVRTFSTGEKEVWYVQFTFYMAFRYPVINQPEQLDVGMVREINTTDKVVQRLQIRRRLEEVDKSIEELGINIKGDPKLTRMRSNTTSIGKNRLTLPTIEEK